MFKTHPVCVCVCPDKCVFFIEGEHDEDISLCSFINEKTNKQIYVISVSQEITQYRQLNNEVNWVLDFPITLWLGKHKTKQNKTRQGKTKQNKTKQNKTKHNPHPHSEFKGNKKAFTLEPNFSDYGLGKQIYVTTNSMFQCGSRFIELYNFKE